MPVFLEKKLKKEYGNNPHAIYGTLNKIGAMHGNKETKKGHTMERKHEMAQKMGVKKRMVSKELEENRKHPRHGFRHELMQGSSDKYRKNMQKEFEDHAWKYARLNPTSDKRIF